MDSGQYDYFIHQNLLRSCVNLAISKLQVPHL